MGSNPRTTAIFIILVAAAVGYMVYDGAGISLLGMSGLKAGQARNVVMQDSIGMLEAQIDSAKRELARGTVEDLRRRIEGHRASLAMLRRLVPVRSEVPNLLDDISTRAKIRGVTLSEVVPQAAELGPTPFDTDKYNIAVLGRYDEIAKSHGPVGLAYAADAINRSPRGQTRLHHCNRPLGWVVRQCGKGTVDLPHDDAPRVAAFRLIRRRPHGRHTSGK